MLDFFSNRERKERFFLVLDIGTEAIKTLICENSLTTEKTSPNQRKIIILGSSLRYFDADKLFWDRNLGVEEAKKVIQGAIKEAYQNLFFSLVDKKTKEQARDYQKLPVLLTLSPNIYKARILYQTYQRNNPQENISKAEEENIKQQILDKTQKDISDKFSKEFGILPQDLQWISWKFLGAKINGYPASFLQGYQGKDLEFKILATFLPRYYLENIKKIFKELGITISAIVHEAENLAGLLDEERKDGIFLDIGGEITEIFFVKNNNLEQINEFKVGGKVFSQAISQIFGLDEKDARILKEQYSNKLISSKASAKITEILGRPQNIWYDGLIEEIEESKPELLFLPKFFIFGGGGLIPIISESLKGENAKENKSLSSPSQVSFIYPKDLKNLEDATKGLNSPQNTPSLLICYAQKNL